MPPLLARLFAIDTRTLALFRISLGTILLIDLIEKSLDIVAFYTDRGILPRDIFLSQFKHTAIWSFHLVSGSVWIQLILFLLASLAAVCLIVGYNTRMATILCWVLLTSLHYRNPMILQGGDVLLRMLTFWSMFVPLGSSYSIDRAIDPQPSSHNEQRIVSMGTTALLLQVVILYWFTALLKTDQKWIPDGTAIYYALMLDAFATPIGLWLRQFPLVMQALTYIVYVLEAGAIIFLMSPWRTMAIRSIGVILLIMMHIGIGVCMSLGLFPLVDIVALLLFIPSSWWDYIQLYMPKSTQITVYYDDTCFFCTMCIRILRIAFFVPEPNIKPASLTPVIDLYIRAEHSWVAILPDHTVVLRFHAWLAFCKLSPILRLFLPFFSSPAILPYGQRLYVWIANRRNILGHITSYVFSSKCNRQPMFFSRITSFVCFFALVCVIWWNIASVPGISIRVPSVITSFVYATHIDQRWNLFAPYPRTDDGWYVVSGTLANGRIVDAYHGILLEPSFAKPTIVSEEYQNRHWRKYLMSLQEYRHKNRRPSYGTYICATWNATASQGEQLKNISIYYMHENTMANYATSSPIIRLIWEQSCF